MRTALEASWKKATIDGRELPIPQAHCDRGRPRWRLAQWSEHQAHSSARARARAQGKGTGGGRSAARSQKKSGNPLWGGRGRRHERAEREVILELTSEAQDAGVRLAAACHMLGISARSIERWRAGPEIADRRCGPQRWSSNALKPAEEGAGRDCADKLALRWGFAEAAGSAAGRRRAIPRVRLDDVPSAATT